MTDSTGLSRVMKSVAKLPQRVRRQVLAGMMDLSWRGGR